MSNSVVNNQAQFEVKTAWDQNPRVSPVSSTILGQLLLCAFRFLFYRLRLMVLNKKIK